MPDVARIRRSYPKAGRDSVTTARPTTGVVIPERETIDEFANTLARIGFGTPSLLEGTTYPLTRLTRDYMLMQSLYRTNWIARKIIDAQVEDMFKNWVELTTELEPDQLDRFNKTIRATQTKAKLQYATKWGRLFGGAAAVIIIAGHEDILDPARLQEHRRIRFAVRTHDAFVPAAIRDFGQSLVRVGIFAGCLNQSLRVPFHALSMHWNSWVCQVYLYPSSSHKDARLQAPVAPGRE